jgi:DNA-binding PadR family transcriptional regulator
MYRDRSLIPSEAVRLAVLGALSAGPRPYGELSGAARHFCQRVVGPSLDLLGPSVELLRVEGLIEAAPEAADDRVRLTEAGRRELHRLLTAPLSGPMGGINRLIVALKMRFLNLLPPEEQRQQIGLLIELCEDERVRVADLRRHHTGEPGHLTDWLDHDLAEIETRLAWLRDLAARLSQ